MPTIRLILVVLLALPALSQADAVDSLLDKYRQKGAEEFSANQGQALWRTSNRLDNGTQHSCGDCHGSDLKQAGKHAKTGKRIEPMAPSVNPERLTDTAKIEKWFLRNCKWTLGRACTPQEKGNFLVYLQQQ